MWDIFELVTSIFIWCMVAIANKEAAYIQEIISQQPTPTPTPIVRSVGNVQEQYIAGYTAAGYRLDLLEHMMYSIVPCESGWSVYAYNYKSGAAGLGQFIPSTWQSVSSDTGYWDIYNPWHQGYNMSYLVGTGGLGHWDC